MPTVGDPAPNFSGHDFINNTAFTLSDHAGEVIVLAFVWKNCPHCANEVPRLQQLWTKFQGHGVQVVAVHVSETEAVAQAWLQGLGVTFPAVQDDAGFTIFASYSPGDYGVPHLYIIGRDMVIRRDQPGEVSYATLEGMLMDVVYLRDPIDLAMVMDVSDTMNDPSPSAPSGDKKLDMMKQAMDMITEFLNSHGQSNDRMGLVWFTDDVSVFKNVLNQELMSIPAYSSELRAQIQAHTTGVCTAMGAGLQKGFDILAGGTQGDFAVLCTDGMQNVQPMVAKVGSHYEIVDTPGMYECGGHASVPSHPGLDIASYNTRVHTIGVGITANYAALLQEIANATGGFYKGTDDPENDLDLIYFTDLCHCMAGASPSVILHRVGAFAHDACLAHEQFQIDRTVRKITVLLSWPHASKSGLFFWLHAPDGSFVDCHEEMQLFETYALATLYLPKEQDDVAQPFVGTWTMNIRGEAGEAGTAYHAMVVAEDRDLHFRLDIPRKLYEVGDLVPLRCQFLSAEDPPTVRNVIVETAQLRVPIAELLARYTISEYELRKRSSQWVGKQPMDLLPRKIAALCADRRFRELVKPARTTASLAHGDLKCEIAQHEVLIPVRLTQPGLITFKVEVQAEAAKGGPVQRTDVVSLFVDPGKLDLKRSTLNVMEVTTKGGPGYMVQFTPRNAAGHLFGPALGGEFQLLAGKRSHPIEAEDLLDGSYRLEFALPKELGKGEQLAVAFKGQTVWTR